MLKRVAREGANARGDARLHAQGCTGTRCRTGTRGWASLLTVIAGGISCGGCASNDIGTMLDHLFRGWIIDPLSALLFFDLWFWDNAQSQDLQAPLVVVWLLCAACYFTLRYRFVSVRCLGHALRILVGRAPDPPVPSASVLAVSSDPSSTATPSATRTTGTSQAAKGDLTHFQALSSALSATVGLGNIGGVAVAISVGGPGATLWMILAGFLGMSSKFVECTLAQVFRRFDEQGGVVGGPMQYIEVAYRGLDRWLPTGWARPTTARGGPAASHEASHHASLADHALASSNTSVRHGEGHDGGIVARWISTIFCFFCVGASLGMGCMFQANQSHAQTATQLSWFSGFPGTLVFGLLLAGLVAAVILGGVQRIATVASRIVPWMCVAYCLAGFGVLIVCHAQLPDAIRLVVRSAWSPEAGYGGVLGVAMTGFRRACFSNEAGIGSAAIVHAAATTRWPIREGYVAMLEPLLDTVVVCTMTALVVVVTGAYLAPGEGVLMTSHAFASVWPWFPGALVAIIATFAFSTMISWSYYGERCVQYLWGPRAAMPYRMLFLAGVLLGVLLPLGSIVEFADLMVLGMAFLNIPALVMLGKNVDHAERGYRVARRARA